MSRSNECQNGMIARLQHGTTSQISLLGGEGTAATTTTKLRLFPRKDEYSAQDIDDHVVDDDDDDENDDYDYNDDTEENLRVVIVGGGVGALATAARIASSSQSAANVQVTVLEKNNVWGGRCGSFSVDIPGHGRFRHERGPSLLLLPQVYQELFDDCSPSFRHYSSSSLHYTTFTPSLEKQQHRYDSSASEYYGLVMKQCVPAYQVIFDDGDSIQVGVPRTSATSTAESEEIDAHRQKQLEEEIRRKMDSYEPNGAAKWEQYMQTMSAYLNCGLPNFIEEKLDLASFPSFVMEAVRDAGKFWPLQPHSDVLDALFVSEKMKAMAAFQDLYVGLEPYRRKEALGGGVLRKTAPAVFGLLAAIELHPTNDKAGVFAPIGGFGSVSSALCELALDCGVELRCNAAVTTVTDRGVYYKDTKSNSFAEFLPADLVIVNADLPYATQTLLQHQQQQQRSKEKETPSLQDDEDGDSDLHHSAQDFDFEMESAVEKERYDYDDGYDFSSGVIAFHWSVKKRLDVLNTHNVFLVTTSREAAERSWSVVRNDNLDNDIFAEGTFNFYLHRPSCTDATAAPENCDSILVLVPCRSLVRQPELADMPRDKAIEIYKQQFSKEFVSTVRQAVLDRLCTFDESLGNLHQSILHETVDTPGTYAEQYNVAAGVPFGLSHGFLQLSVTRPGAQSNNMDNVLFVGASSRPGNGVPLVFLGAKNVAKLALRKLREISRRQRRRREGEPKEDEEKEEVEQR